MGPVEAIRTCLAKYATFSGRASRSEFWWFHGWIMAGTLVLSAVYFLVSDVWVRLTILVITMIVGFGLLVPYWSVTFRRFHDIGLPGWLIIAAYTLGFVLDRIPEDSLLSLPAALVSLAVGMIGVLAARRFDRLVAFSIIGSMGMVLVSIALFTPAGIAAALY